EVSLTIRQRMRIRDEEHQALEGLLPPDLASKALRLNVAAREAGQARVVTADAVYQLGAEGIRRVVGLADPKAAALAIVRALARGVQRGIEREVERERD